MTKERRLGRGLEALFGRIPAARTAAAPKAPPTVAPVPRRRARWRPGSRHAPCADPPGSDAAGGTTDLQAAAAAGRAGPRRRGSKRRLIDSNPSQPRQDFDQAEMQSLAESLQTHGLLQPVVVRRRGDRYQLVAGERRLRAAIKAGWSDVPVNVVEADDRQMAELAIVENLQRKDLNPLEKAASFQRYLEQYGCTQEESGRAAEARPLDDRQPDPAAGTAGRRAGSPAAGEDHPGPRPGAAAVGRRSGSRSTSAQRIQQEGLNVRQTESLVQETIDQADAEPLAVAGKVTRSRRSSQHLAALEQEFRAALGLKVKLTESGRGRGKLVIPFSTHEEFERIRDVICGEEDPATRTRAG